MPEPGNSIRNNNSADGELESQTAQVGRRSIGAFIVLLVFVLLIAVYGFINSNEHDYKTSVMINTADTKVDADAIALPDDCKGKPLGSPVANSRPDC